MDRPIDYRPGAVLTNGQADVFSRLQGSYEAVDVYDIGELVDGAVLMHGIRIAGSSLAMLFSLIEADGTQRDESDGLNQFYWLQDIESGRFEKLTGFVNDEWLAKYASYRQPRRDEEVRRARAS